MVILVAVDWCAVGIRGESIDMIEEPLLSAGFGCVGCLGRDGGEESSGDSSSSGSGPNSELGEGAGEG